MSPRIRAGIALAAAGGVALLVAGLAPGRRAEPPLGARFHLRTLCGRETHTAHGRAVTAPACVQLTTFQPVELTPHAGSGVFRARSARPVTAVRGEDDPGFDGGGAFRPLPKAPRIVSLAGMGKTLVATRAKADVGVSIAHTYDLSQASDSSLYVARSGLPLTDVAQASETSVAMSGKVVLFTANRLGPSGAAALYSTNGGATFSELDVTTVFPAPTYANGPASACSPACDQVVMYDPYAGTFVWVVQYPADVKANDDVIRVAYATPAAVAARGAKAWRYVDLVSRKIYGAGNAFDQPRLGMTPGYLYISFNQPRGAIVRIRHTALQANLWAKVRPLRGSSSPSAVEAVAGGSDFFRVAQDVRGDREYFVGLRGGNSAALAVASIADDEPVLETALVDTWSRADANTVAAWSSTTPDGSNWLARLGTSQQTNVTGVTMAGDGSIWAAWSESRDVNDPKDHTKVVDLSGHDLPTGAHTYPQPHIGLVQLRPFRVSSSSVSGDLKLTVTFYGYELGAAAELVNPAYALAMPDLATDASGEVAMGFYGGGGSYYVNHAVGFVGPTRLELVNDATSSAFTADNLNDYGDYQTVRPAAAPYGDCLLAASAVTSTADAWVSPTKRENQLVFTVFSRPGVACPKPVALPKGRPFPKPGRPPSRPSGPQASTLTLACPKSAAGSAAVTVTGTLAGAIAAPVTISAPGLPGGSATASTGADGGFSLPYTTPAEIQQVTVTATFAGNAALAPSRASCTIAVTGLPTALALSGPASPVPAGSAAAVTVQLTVPEAGAAVALTYTAPGGAKTVHTVTTDAAGKATDTVQAAAPGTWSVAAHYGGSKTRPPADAQPLTFPVLARAAISLACATPGKVVLGAGSSFTGTLAPATNGTPVQITYTPPAGSKAKAATDAVTTDATGYFADTFGWPDSGIWTVTARFAGDAKTAPATSSACTVTVLAP